MEKYTVAEIKKHLLAGTFPAYAPLGVSAEILGLTKSGLLRRAETETSRLRVISITSEMGTSWTGVTVESLAKEVDYQENHRARTTKAAFDLLHELVMTGETREYGEFMEAIGLAWRNPIHRKLTGAILGRISTVAYRRHGLLPSVLVVSKKTEKPSPAFFRFARDLGVYAGPGTQSENVFFEQTKTDVFASKKRAGVWKWREEYGQA